jgi:hypothetical protein
MSPSSSHPLKKKQVKIIIDTGLFLFHSASNDNIRLWNAAESSESDGFGKPRSGVQFKIIPGHHGGYISQMRECLALVPFRVLLTASFQWWMWVRDFLYARAAIVGGMVTPLGQSLCMRSSMCREILPENEPDYRLIEQVLMLVVLKQSMQLNHLCSLLEKKRVFTKVETFPTPPNMI